MNPLSPEQIHFIIERSCLQKKNLTKEEADVIVDIHAFDKRMIYYYKCQFCGSYHMTSKPERPEHHLVLQWDLFLEKRQLQVGLSFCKRIFMKGQDFLRVLSEDIKVIT